MTHSVFLLEEKVMHEPGKEKEEDGRREVEAEGRSEHPKD